MNNSTSQPTTEKVSERVCVVCGASLINHRPDARHCSPVCRVETHRLRAILSGASSSPYKSIKERLEAAQKAYKGPLVTRNCVYRDDNTPSVRNTAIGKLVSNMSADTELQNRVP